jgi:hypothetical protein
MRQKIGFGTGVTRQRRKDLPGDDIAADDESGRAMTKILKLSALDLAWCQGQAWMFPFQRLHAGQLVCAHGSLSLFMPIWR